MAEDKGPQWEIARGMNVDLRGYRLNYTQKRTCEQIIGLMERLSADIKRRAPTLTPGSTGQRMALGIWRRELELIQARIERLVREMIETNTGPDGYGKVYHDLTANANTNHATKLPANTMRYPGPKP